MKRRLAVLAAAVLGLFVSVGSAAASDGGGSAEQAAGQAAASGQAAAALSGAEQTKPTNQNISVRVLSPGNGGSVTQSNTVSSDATAANANLTGQSADQAQSGSCGCEGGTQAVGQSAENDQAAAALSLATQAGATNRNIPVRVLSPGDDGDVEQTNAVESDATAANANATGQSAEQDQAGGGTQAIGQAAKSDQDALAASKAEQHGAENTNISVRVLSPGDDGDVEQSNTVESSADAANLNLTGQKADQDGGGSGGTQAIGQAAKSDQDAIAASAAKQHGASNTNVPVRVLSPGDGGDVEQKNRVDSDAKAVNLNATKQDADQSRSGRGCECSGGTQAIGQSATSDQAAVALSAALQSGASNTNTPVRVASKGDDGDVEQSNEVESDATAANLNLTGQKADQEQSGGGCKCSDGTQAIGQSAESSQGALAASLAAQAAGHDRCGCGSGGNTNAPVRVDSHGDGGSVEQENEVDSKATAANLNLTGQKAEQDGGGGGTQAIGQAAKSEQGAAAFSAALQSGASNANTPVRVASHGDDGDVEQSNEVDSEAKALNANLTKQDADQAQHGGDCRCKGGIGIQAIGQEAKNHQHAAALSLALQAGAKNDNSPVRVASHGGGGDVEQSNEVDSDATAANLNALKQDADQDQAGGSGIAIQAIGQSAKNEQGALALSAALQLGASNSNSPVAVFGKGDGGDVEQSNEVDSDATALNANLTEQDADQGQWSRKDCGCHGLGIQAIGQESKNEQGALAASLALQAFGHGKCGCSAGGNSNTPVGIGGYGSGGSVEQSNEADSDATALNLNALGQDADQHGSGGGIQAIGQSAKNRQLGIGLSAAFQLGASNRNAPYDVRSRRWLHEL